MMTHLRANRKASRGLVATALLLVLAGPGSGDEDIEGLIDGIVARATVIHSLQLDYSYSAEVLQAGRRTHEQQLDLHVAIEGPHWIVRQGRSPNFRLRRQDATVSYTEAKSSQTGQVSRSLHIEAPESLLDLIGEHAAYAAPRLGSFWFPQQAEFVDQHRRQTRLAGTRRVDDIETLALEWPVEATDLDEAMIVIPNAIARARRGRLRVWVAPSLGYALPNIEYVTLDGRVVQQYTASDFDEFDGQVFFPRQAGCTTTLDDGEEISGFQIHRIESLNQTLPADTFSMQIPRGTRVRDSRPGVPMSVFYVDAQNQIDDLNRSLDPNHSSPRSSRRTLLLIVNSAFLLTCLLIYVVQRCSNRRSQPC